MKRLLRALGHEIRAAVYPVLFFLAVFHLVGLTKVLLLETYSITVTSASVATVMALTVAKAVVILDGRPFMEVFAGRPRIWNVAFRTLVFATVAGVFRFLEELVGLVLEHNHFRTAVERLAGDVSWPVFFATQLWLLVALLMFDGFAAIDRHFGKGNVRKALFGSRGGYAGE